MQKLFAILLICSLGFHSLAKLGIVAWYEINKDYVADVLCINKDKPELNCKGKCYLKKQLNKTDEQQNSQDGKVVDTKIEIAEYVPASIKYDVQEYYTVSNQSFSAHYQDDSSQDFTRDIFHPPIV